MKTCNFKRLNIYRRWRCTRLLFLYGIDSPCHNVSSLLPFFANAMYFKYSMEVQSLGRAVSNVDVADAYQIVIQEVLTYMEDNGLLYRDQQERYQLSGISGS